MKPHMLTKNHIVFAAHAIFFPLASDNYESTLGVTLLELINDYKHIEI